MHHPTNYDRNLLARKGIPLKEGLRYGAQVVQNKLGNDPSLQSVAKNSIFEKQNNQQ